MAKRKKYRDISTDEPGIYIRGNSLRANISHAQKTKKVTLNNLMPCSDAIIKLAQTKHAIELLLKTNEINLTMVNSDYVTLQYNQLFKPEPQQIQKTSPSENIQKLQLQQDIIKIVDNTEFVDVLLVKQIEVYRNRITEKGYQRGKIVSTTFQDYQRYIKYLIPHFTGINIKDLNKNHIAIFISKHCTINFQTVLDYLIPLKAITKFQNEVDNISKNIFDDSFVRSYAIETCKDVKKSPLPYSDNELDLLKSTPHSHIRDIALGASITGLRAGEIIALRWKNVKISKRKIYIVVQFTKNTFKRLKSEHGRRVLPITDDMLELLLCRYKHSNGCDFVFCDPHDTSSHWKNSTKINKELKKMHEKLGIMHRCFHNTRKTFAKNDFEEGNNILKTAQKLGHKNPQETYDSYLEIVQDGFEDYEEDTFLSNLKESENYE